MYYGLNKDRALIAVQRAFVVQQVHGRGYASPEQIALLRKYPLCRECDSILWTEYDRMVEVCNTCLKDSPANEG